MRQRVKQDLIDMHIIWEDLHKIDARNIADLEAREEFVAARMRAGETIRDVKGKLDFLDWFENDSPATSVLEEEEQRISQNWKPMIFTGVLNEWLGWWDWFESSIHSKWRMSKNEKMSCL